MAACPWCDRATFAHVHYAWCECDSPCGISWCKRIDVSLDAATPLDSDYRELFGFPDFNGGEQ